MIIDAFDVVSWVKDGAWVLPVTLKKLDEVLPTEFVHRKIAVDDHSSDDSVKILKEFGWDVYPNPNSGISSGANYALNKVDCPFFMSFEQDLLLAKKWFPKIPELVCGNVGAASGVRFSSGYEAVRSLERYVYRKYLHDEKLAPYLSNRKESAFTLGKTLDNTVFRTKVIRGIGGFPFMACSSGVDTVLAHRIKESGFKWVVDSSVESVHLRKNMAQILNHQSWYATAMKESKKYLPNRSDVGIGHSFGRLAMSPLVGCFVAVKMGNPKVCAVHPLMRLYNFLGYLKQ